jgi:hypothetical protein
MPTKNVHNLGIHVTLLHNFMFPVSRPPSHPQKNSSKLQNVLMKKTFRQKICFRATRQGNRVNKAVKIYIWRAHSVLPPVVRFHINSGTAVYVSVNFFFLNFRINRTIFVFKYIHIHIYIYIKCIKYVFIVKFERAIFRYTEI